MITFRPHKFPKGGNCLTKGGRKCLAFFKISTYFKLNSPERDAYCVIKLIDSVIFSSQVLIALRFLSIYHFTHKPFIMTKKKNFKNDETTVQAPKLLIVIH